VLHGIHIAVRAVGIIVIFLLLIGSLVFYFSDEYDLLCDGLKRLERVRAGKPYHCYSG
jgi:hypothetical protein